MSDEISLTIDLDRKQERALEMILLGEKDAQIATRLGINRTTIYRWRKYDTQFMNALDERQSVMREAAHNMLLELTETAIEAIKIALSDNDNRVRLQAARMVLDLLMMNKPEERKEPSIIDLLHEALVGMDDQLGIKTNL